MKYKTIALTTSILAGAAMFSFAGIQAQAGVDISDKTSTSIESELFNIMDKDRWLVRFRLIDVDPDEASSVSGLNGDVTADNALVPEIDISYFFTDHIAAELILATSKHDMGTNTGVSLGDVWVLPPTVTLQYHFNPEGKWRPYAGAGIGYIMYYNEDPGDAASISYKNGLSFALQTGMDIGIDKHWAFNIDIKKQFHNTNVNVGGGAITADVDLDPWIFGVGLAYRF